MSYSRFAEILLIEDNPHEAALVLRCLKKKGLLQVVLHIDDSEKALEWIFARGAYIHRTTGPPPKLIILDINMPKISGTEILKILKKDEKYKLIPVVMLTSSKEEKDVEECYTLGANAYIVKPISFPEFSKAVEQLAEFWALINHPPFN